jgi:hypothetical protein
MTRRFSAVVLCLVLLFLSHSQATASFISLTAGANLRADNGQYRVDAISPTLLPADFGTFSMSTAERKILTDGSAAGKFNGKDYPAVQAVTLTNGGPLQGTFNFTTFSAGISGGLGGLIIDKNGANGVIMNYIPPTNLTFGKDVQLDFVQFIHTNDPIGAISNNTVYLDPGTPDDNLPFYWTQTERATEGKGWVTGGSQATDPRFSDGPSRLLTDAPVNWTADLFLVSYNTATPTKVTVYDGVNYGFTIRAVPEPPTVVLFAIGVMVAMVLFLRKRRLAVPLLT